MTPAKLSKKKITLLIVGALLLTLAIGVLIPVSMSNGSEKFEGEEKRMAQLVLDQSAEYYSQGEGRISAIGTYKVRITDVRSKTPPEDSTYTACYDIFSDNVGLFGYVGDKGSTTRCILPDGSITHPS